jgi:hypothetical protein
VPAVSKLRKWMYFWKWKPENNSCGKTTKTLSVTPGFLASNGHSGSGKQTRRHQSSHRQNHIRYMIYITVQSLYALTYFQCCRCRGWRDNVRTQAEPCPYPNPDKPLVEGVG